MRQDDLDRAIVKEMPRLRALAQYNRLRRQNNALPAKLVAVATLSVLRQRLGLVGGMDANERKVAADLQTANMDTFRDVLRQAKARADAWGGQLYFVYLREWARYTRYTSSGKSKRGDVLTSVRNLGIPIVDLDSTFRAQSDPLSLFPFREVGHYNEVGHRVVADAVLEAISVRH